MSAAFKRTRIAPTPSGFLHLGNVYSFALTAALASKSGASLFLRIDDLDRERMEAEYVEDIFDTLRFLGISWQEGPRDLEDFETRYSQLHRLKLYMQALERLKEKSLLFACQCSRKQLRENHACSCMRHKIPMDAPDVCWRLKTKASKPVKVKTIEGFAHATFPESMRQFIVRKKDGRPSYQLCSVVDDLHFGIDLVVRGQDLWDSTLAQHYLAQALDETEFSKITFFHHGLLTDASGKKLSKSDGDTSVRYYRKEKRSAEELYEELGKTLNIPCRSVKDFHSQVHLAHPNS